MNSVHEPGSNGDSKTSPSQKSGQKTKPGARVPSWHAQVRTGAPRRAHGRARAVVSWLGPGCVVARDRSYRGRLNVASQAAPRPCRGLHGRIAGARPRAWPAVSQALAASQPSRVVAVALGRVAGPNVVSQRAPERIVGVCTRSYACCAARLAAQAHCIVIQLPSRQATLVTIHYVYCDTNGQPSSHCPSCCVTIQFLCIKTQSLNPLAFLLQYSSFSGCNTIPATSLAIQTCCIPI